MKVKREINHNMIPPRLRVNLMSVLLPEDAFFFFFFLEDDLAFSFFSSGFL